MTKTNPILYEGDILDHYQVGERLAVGGQGKVHSGIEKSTGRKVVIKRYNDDDGDTISSWDSLDKANEGAAREISFLRRANADNINHLPTLVAAGTTGAFQDPVAVFDLIHGDTLRKQARAHDYNPSLDDVLKVVELLKEPINYAHTFGVHPIVHRDIKPDNIMINGDGATLLDWGISRKTIGKTRTRLVEDGFVSHEISEGLSFDGRADVYSMGRVLQYMLLGEDVFDAVGQKPSLSHFERFNLPKGLVQVLETATREKPEKRFETAMKFYEAAVKSYGSNLPVQVKTQEKKPEAPRQNGKGIAWLPIIYKDGDGNLRIDDILYDDNDNVYATAKSILDTKLEFSHRNNSHTWLATPEERKRDFLSYLQHAAQEHPVLQEVLDSNRKKTLEDVVREKKSNFIEAAVSEGHSTPRDLGKLEDAKTAFDERRRDLYEVFGLNESSQEGAEAAFGVGAALGFIGGAFVSEAVFNGFEVIPRVIAITSSSLGGTYLVAKGCEKIVQNLGQRKLLREAREMDSWVAEARRSQQPSDLEREVGEVVLREEEKSNLAQRSLVDAVGASFATMSTLYLSNAMVIYPENPRLALFQMGLIGLVGAITGIGNYFSLKERSLAKKRLANGLDEDGRKRYESPIETNYQATPDAVEKIFLERGLKKRLFENEFYNEEIKVKYKPKIATAYEVEVSWTDIDIHYKPGHEDKAKEITYSLQKYKLPRGGRSV